MRGAVPHNGFAFQRRTFLGFARKKAASKAPRNPQPPPGVEKMLNLLMMEKIQARPPPPNELVEALTLFIKDRIKKKLPFNNYQAEHTLRTFQHLQELDKTRRPEDAYLVPTSILHQGMTSLCIMPADKRILHAHKELARELFEELSRRAQNSQDVDESTKTSISDYNLILTLMGETQKAYDSIFPLIIEFGDSLFIMRAWERILQGFAVEGNEEKLIQVFDNPPLADDDMIKACRTMFEYYANKNNVPEAKIWYGNFVKSKPKNPPRWHQNHTRLLLTLLPFSLRHNEQQWCNQIFKSLIESKQSLLKPEWDVVFQWAAGAMGKGVEDVERLMKVMIKSGEEREHKLRPNAKTINGLVSLAMSRKDPYLAERYLDLGRRFDVLPDATTYMLQMEYRLVAGDMSGVFSAYEALQSEEVAHHADVPILNKYLRALCAEYSPNHDLINAITDDLDKRSASLDPETVASLCIHYIHQGDTNSMIDVLQVHSYHWQYEERALVRKACIEYILDPETDTTTAWECYQIMAHIFQETPVSERTAMLREFFRRQRSDMALHVFGHMRAHGHHEFRPAVATYAECFEGIANCHDAPSLDVVYNMLKMDLSIEPNTMLLNSLMRAYTECGDSSKAIGFWEDITNSREGPNYRSLELVFRACQTRYFGYEKAHEIWAKMRKMDIEVTRDVWIAFVGAIAGQGKLNEAKTLVESGEKDWGLPPDMLT